MFKDSIIELYTITYDQDPDQTYSFVDFDKAVASIETSIRGYIGDEDENTDDITNQLVAAIRKNKHHNCIPIRLNDLMILLYRIDIDDANRIHRVLEQSYHQVDDATKENIELLFTPVVSRL